GPSHTCDFVGKRSRDLDRTTIHQTCEPEPLRAVLARIADDGHGAGNQQPAQMSIALLRDPAEPLFTSGRMLSRPQPDPCSKAAAGRKHLPISHLSNLRGGATFLRFRRIGARRSGLPNLWWGFSFSRVTLGSGG